MFYDVVQALLRDTIEVDLEFRRQRAIDVVQIGMERNARGIAKLDRKSTRLNSSHIQKSRMPSSA